MIISVQFKSKFNGQWYGNNYSYICDFPVKKGDIVKVPTKFGDSEAIVRNTNIPPYRVDPKIFPLLKKVDSIVEGKDNGGK